MVGWVRLYLEISQNGSGGGQGLPCPGRPVKLTGRGSIYRVLPGDGVVAGAKLVQWESCGR